MRFATKCLVLLLWLGGIAAQAQHASRTPFRHVVVIFQENRTPDNLFRGLLTWPGINPANYDIATFGVNSKGENFPGTSPASAFPTKITRGSLSPKIPGPRRLR